MVFSLYIWEYRLSFLIYLATIFLIGVFSIYISIKDTLFFFYFAQITYIAFPKTVFLYSIKHSFSYYIFAQIVNFCILPIYIVKTLFFLCILPRIIYIAIFLYIYLCFHHTSSFPIYIINTLFSFLDLAQISS